jgi:hypothetical protein
MSEPSDALSALARMRIIDPSGPLSISREDWEKYKQIMNNPAFGDIVGHVILLQSAELSIVASGGVEVTSTGIRLLPPQAKKKPGGTTALPLLPLRRHI